MESIFVDAALKSCLKDVFSTRPVILAYLFGSAATGRMTPLSDVDIALVLIEGRYDENERLKIELEIEEEIARKCDIPNADVRVINAAPIAIRGTVVTEGILLYSRDEETRVEFETRSRSEYFDFLPIIESIQEAHLERLRGKGLYG